MLINVLYNQIQLVQYGFVYIYNMYRINQINYYCKITLI